MKRMGILLLLALFLAGCGSDAPTVGICLKQDRGQSLETQLINAGYQVTAVHALEDQSNQTRQVETMIREEVDLIIIEPVMMELAEPFAELAKQAGVPMIFLGHQPPQRVLNAWEQAFYIGTREEQPGTCQGQILEKLPRGGDLNGDGTVSYVVIAGPEDHLDAKAYTENCIATAQGNCLDIRWGDWTRESGRIGCGRLLATYGEDIEVVFCNSDILAQGALEAIEDYERSVGKDIYLVGLGGDRQSRLLVRSGDFSGTVYLDEAALTDRIAETAQQLLTGKRPERLQYGEYILVTSENVEDFLP